MTIFNILLLIFLVCMIPFIAGALLLAVLSLSSDIDTPMELDSDLDDSDLDSF
jgi:hypothetical protein